MRVKTSMAAMQKFVSVYIFAHMNVCVYRYVCIHICMCVYIEERDTDVQREYSSACKHYVSTPYLTTRYDLTSNFVTRCKSPHLSNLAL